MTFDPSQSTPAQTRREFLRRSLEVGGAGLLLPALAMAEDRVEPPAPPTVNASRHLPSRIVRCSSERLTNATGIQSAVFRSALTQALQLFTGEHSAADAWHRLLRPDDVILVKCNQSGSRALGTTPLIAGEIVDQLLTAGWAPEKIMVLEAGSPQGAMTSTRPPDLRFPDRVITFGSAGSDRLLAALNEATAIINVPFLKTHHLATMTGCLKNLSHGLIQHPARFHGGGCDPAIAQIVASEAIREKLRLNIVNAVRVVFDRGPEARSNEIHTTGTILVGTDPVACDAVGYSILNEIRALRKIGPLLSAAALPRQLLTAQNLGLGEADIEQIQLVHIQC